MVRRRRGRGRGIRRSQRYLSSQRHIVYNRYETILEFAFMWVIAIFILWVIVKHH